MLQLCWVKRGLHTCVHVFYSTASPNMSNGTAYRHSMMDDWIIFIIIGEVKQPNTEEG